jgi:hypothetical protein
MHSCSSYPPELPWPKGIVACIAGPVTVISHDVRHGTLTLGEFGLIGKLKGATVLMNDVTLPALVQDPTSTLDRTLWLVF